MTSNTLGDRMKSYEAREAQRRTLPGLPIILRIDGKGFSNWTKGLKYPFDERLENLRRDTATALIRELNPLIGYCQSDEISLVFYSSNLLTQIHADGRFQKLVSHSASIATAVFNSLIAKYTPEKSGQLAYFDSRAWEVPSLEEAANTLLWRELDATKNSISMAARSVYLHKEIHGKNSSELQEMLWQKGINWNDYPVWAKRGTYLRRETYCVKLTIDEMNALPAKHQARNNPDMIIERSEIRVMEMPPFSKVSNRIDVILGATPKVEK